MQVGDIASKRLITCKARYSIADAFDMLTAEKAKRRLVIVNGNRFAGMLTATDMLSALGAGPKRVQSLTVSVSRIAEKEVPWLEEDDSLQDALWLMQTHGRGAYPVLDGERPVGILSEADLLKLASSEKEVKEIMRPAMIAKPHWPVRDVARMMVNGAFRRFPIVDQGFLVGIVSPYDILKHLKKSKKLLRLRNDLTPIEKIMQKNVASIDPEASVNEAVNLMRLKRVGALPVTEDGELLGIVTERDMLNFVEV